MEPKAAAAALGSSLAVPCVQELAKERPSSVPQRYIRPDQDPPVNSDSSSLPQVPVIDMHKLLSKVTMETELEKMHQACKEWGFFQLINHKVSPSLVEKVKSEVQEFFELPMEEKKNFWQKPGDLEGFGQAFVVSEEQKLDWADMFYLTTLPTSLRRPHLFPKLPLPFREALEDYSAQIQVLAKKIVDLMAQALQMDANYMRELFDDGWQSMRMNYYPPCPQPDLVIGLNPHSDGVGLTILLQVNEMQGLQIKKNGQWIPVVPLPDAFVINIGDLLEIITNGIYPSIEHRATVNSQKERLSIATFYCPNLEANIGPAPSILTPDNPAKFGKIRVRDYLRGYLSRELREKSYLDTIKI